ncbi:MAG: DUF1552 domain-containing protein [Saccharospirillaceae bacterium]|nr:DUF1552 domain-containing protein [Pseudomonadales bacterium]NRB81907.1 DUF1552 domain-containing protein [Saccharospirillaceae bacterium]
MKRRRFIKLSGAISMSPALMFLFKDLHASALGNEIQNKTFFLYNHANGLNRTCVRKAKDSTGSVVAQGPLTTLADNIKQVSVVDTLRCDNGVDQHGNGIGAYTCAGDDPNEAAGPSIDWTIAQGLSAEPLSSSLILGLPFRRNDFNCASGLTVSAFGARQKRIPEYDLFATWNKYFDSTQISIPRGSSAMNDDLRAHLLARVGDDTKRQMALLPSYERQKAQQYIDSLNQLEKTFNSVRTPCSDFSLGNNLEISANQVQRNLQSSTDHLENYWDAMMSMSAALVSCGLKNQVSFLHSIGCAHMLYPTGRNDGTVFNGHWHDSLPVGEGDGLSENELNEEFNTAPKFVPFSDKQTGDGETGADMDYVLSLHAGHINKFWNLLKQAPDYSGGNMADNATLVWASDGGGKHHDGQSSYCPIIVSGDNTRIKKGVFVPGSSRPIADLWLTLAAQHDINLERFGDGTNGGTTKISELLI